MTPDRAAEALAAGIGLRTDGATRARIERAVRDGAADLPALVDHVTVQESSFFRDAAHIAHITGQVVPAAGPSGLIWSAGCANGQEPWSLAMALEESRAPGWRVLATDVSQAALARARAGVYADRELRGLSGDRRARFFEPCDGGHRIRAVLRDRVDFAAHNLAADPPPPGTGRVILCRHVLIYFRAGAARTVLRHLRAAMPVDGWLYLGGGEALTAAIEHFRLVPLDGALAYRPRVRDRRPAVPARRHRPPPPVARRRRVPLPTVADLASSGERAMAAGDAAAAVRAFRQAAYLSPVDPLAHLRLGLALESSGDATAAARAFRAARAALEHAGGGVVEGRLSGWSAGEMARLLAHKLGAA
jgi:chemotaxis protein methyltransferase CheR